MSDPFVAEIRIFPFNFAPRGWAFCDGQLMPISQNTALFSLLGTIYGGNGKSTFGLPNMQGSSPMQQGQGSTGTIYDIGQTGGTTTVTGEAWSAMASRLRARVPSSPAEPEAVSTSVSSTGLLRGNLTASASDAVQTMPTTAVETVRMGRVPSLISRTRTP